MRTPALAATLTLLAAPAPLRAEEPVDWEVVTRIRDEAFRRSRVLETLRQLSDVIGPRLTGSPGMKRANEWTRQQLESWGLENARLERWGPFGRGWSFSRASVHLLTPRAAPLTALPKAWTPGTDGPVHGPLQRVTLASEADLDRHRGQLAGRVLLLSEPRAIRSGQDPAVHRRTGEELHELERYEIPAESRANARSPSRRRWREREKRNAFLAQEGVLATIEASSRDSGIVRVGRGGSERSDGATGVPALVMAAEHYNWILRLTEDAARDGSKPPELELDVRARFHDDDPHAYNTIAEIAGSDPGAGVVMTGAHLDSWHAGTGATDNAAGCAVAMEAVRILKALGVQPRRTIRIGLWSGEEQGLLGSRAWVAEHLATVARSRAAGQQELPYQLRDRVGTPSPKPEHARFSAYFNLDNGSGRIRGVYAQDNAGVVPIFEAWLRPFRDLGADTVTLRSTGGTDHLAFDAVGLPGFQFIQDRLDYASRTHHSQLDVYDHANREDLMQASAVMASFLYHAATRDELLPRKPMPRYGGPERDPS